MHIYIKLFLNSVFKHVNIYTYARHTHKYKVNMYRLYNGVEEKDDTRIVRIKIYKQSYRQTLTTITRKEKENQAQQQQ